MEDGQGGILLRAWKMHIQEDKDQLLTLRELLAEC